jgi:hypothetical protein
MLAFRRMKIYCWAIELGRKPEVDFQLVFVRETSSAQKSGSNSMDSSAEGFKRGEVW